MSVRSTTPAGRGERLERGPRAPRRVSGPVRGSGATRLAPSRTAATRSAAARRAPRRAGAARLERGLLSLADRAGAFLRSLPDHALVDRLVRGRAWIPVLGVMLVGIVFMQVEVLKLGASVGRSIETTSALTTRNQMLRASVASLSDQARIERLAAAMGMIMPAPASIGFLPARADGNLARALANIHAPDSATFLSYQGSNGGVATSTILSSSDGSIAASLPSSSGASTSSASSQAGTQSAATSTSTSTSPASAQQQSTAGSGAASIGPSTTRGG